MLASELFESQTICPVCGCTPCNCTHIVNEEQLDEASYRDVLKDLLDRFYADMGISPKGGHWFGPLDVKSPGTRVWTRGDGTRYRDPGFIGPGYYSSKEPKKATVIAQKFWQWLQTQPGVKKLGQISGEFGSSKFSDIVVYKGLYFSGGRNGVEFGSASRFKNPRSVWRHKAPEQAVEEGIKDKVAAGLTAAALATTPAASNAFVGMPVPPNPNVKKVAVKQPDGSVILKTVPKTDNKKQVKQVKEESDPCWKGYRQLGTKKKAGKTVPNCVPEGTDIVPATNPEDAVTLDIPLLIRLLEYAREDAKTDMVLHDVAERLITLSAGGKTLSMTDYDTIIPGSSD